MKEWVKTLMIAENETLEQRIFTIAKYIIETFNPQGCTITDIDAIGKLGGTLTLRINEQEVVQLAPAYLLQLLKEDGQIFELELQIANIQISVSRGEMVDLIGEGDIPPSILGENIPQNPANFLL